MKYLGLVTHFLQKQIYKFRDTGFLISNLSYIESQEFHKLGQLDKFYLLENEHVGIFSSFSS